MKTNVLLLDNYDSFTYNLLHYLGEIGADVEVVRNDAITVDAIAQKKPDAIVISPGPGTPDDAGICLDVIKKLGDSIPIFGVCLGHQSIAQAYGGVIVRNAPMHGKVSPIIHHGTSVFKDLPSPMNATRYHSLSVERDSLPECFDITAETEDGIIMGLAHKEHPLHCVQFHPESIASDHGHKMLQNFLNIIG